MTNKFTCFRSSVPWS